MARSRSAPLTLDDLELAVGGAPLASGALATSTGSSGAHGYVGQYSVTSEPLGLNASLQGVGISNQSNTASLNFLGASGSVNTSGVSGGAYLAQGSASGFNGNLSGTATLGSASAW